MAVSVIPAFHLGTYGDTCLLCQCAVPSPARQHDRIIDLGVWMDADEGAGWLAICETCAQEIASLIGCLPDGQAAQLTQLLTETRAKLADLESRQDRLREFVR